MQYPVIEFMVNGGEFGGQRVVLTISRFAEQIITSVEIEDLVDIGMILPGYWQKVL